MILSSNNGLIWKSGGPGRASRSQMVHNVVSRVGRRLANVLLEATERARLTATDLGARVRCRRRFQERVDHAVGAAARIVRCRRQRAHPQGPGQCLGRAALRWRFHKLVGLKRRTSGGGDGDGGRLDRSTGSSCGICWRRLFAVYDETATPMNGVFACRTGDQVVATDGHRLALAIRPLAGAGASVSGIAAKGGNLSISTACISGRGRRVARRNGYSPMPNVLLMARLVGARSPTTGVVEAHPHRIAISRGR
jgi:hypothetical protein